MDPRFDTSRDPRFKRAPVSVRQLKLDKRFARMFEDESFIETPTVDSRGIPLARDSGRQKLRQFYKLEEQPQESGGDAELRRPKALRRKGRRRGSEAAKTSKQGQDGSEEDEAAAQPDAGTEGEDEAAAQPDASAEDEEAADAGSDREAEGEDGEDVDEDEDEDSSDSEDEEAQQASAVWEKAQENIPHGDATRRLAVMGCDWDRIQATDLLVLFRTYLNGRAAANGGISTGSVDKVTIYPSDYGMEEMRKEAELGPAVLEEVEDSDGEVDYEKQQEALRQYALRRTRYHYGVVECDSAATAAWLYDQLDGMEAEGMCPLIMDLRFVPDDITPPHPPKSVATEVPAKYQAPVQMKSSVAHTKVQCSWDDDDPKRKRALQRKRFSAQDLAEMDLQAYLASSDESEGGSGAEALRQLVGEALSGDSGGERGSDEDDSSDDERPKVKDKDMDMEATFSVKATQLEDTLAERARQQGKVKKLKPEEEKSSWEKYLERKKETRRERRQKAKEDKKAQKAATLDENGNPLTVDTADLELIAADEDGADRGFNVRGPQRLVKSGKGRQAKTDASGNFGIDLEDPRIAKVFSSEDFGIDPTHPEFRKSEAMNQLLSRKRQKAAKRKEAIETAAAPGDDAAAAAAAPAAADGTPQTRRGPAAGGLQIFGRRAAEPSASPKSAAAAPAPAKPAEPAASTEADGAEVSVPKQKKRKKAASA